MTQISRAAFARFFRLGQTRAYGLALGLLGALVLAAPAAQAAELKARLQSDIGILDPAFWQSAAEQQVIDAIFPKLIDFKSSTDWEWELSAAESIEQVDDLTISFTLKPGLMWTGDYGEVTAEDVKFSFERFVDPALDAPNKGDWIALKEVEVTGKYSGVIHLKEPFAPIWWSTLPYTSGAILSKAAVEKAGGKITTDPGATSGPYKIAEWHPKQKLVLAAHDGWNGEAPGYDSVTLVPINDEKTAEIAFSAGEVDFAEIAISSVPVLQSDPPEGAKLEVRPTADYFWLGLNVANPKFADIRVRQAIMKAIDVEAILDGAFFGAAPRATGMVAPGLLGYRDITPPARDVEGARKLLDEAGASGLSVELEVQNITDGVTAAQIIHANLAEVGIELQINTHDPGGFWNLGEEKGEALELTLKSYVNPPDASWGTQWFLAEQKGIWNWEYLDDPEFEELHKKALGETDFDKRAAMYVRMQEIMDESGGYLWITYPPSAVVYRDSVIPGMFPNGRMKLSAFKPAS